MEILPFLYTLVLYRTKELESCDVAIGTIVGNDEQGEWIYYPFPEGIAIVEEQLQQQIDIKAFWSEHIVEDVVKESDLIDKYIDLINLDGTYLLMEPYVTHSHSSQFVAKNLENHMELRSYLIQNTESSRIDHLLKN
jgi:hypothetical protein